ncbi:MAG: 3'(2'),5'-bisphosphate nucleotidase CysQ [Bacteroidia bacterium]|nr:3'(2'),5'-bisphosphate nucleotidase CysQ [Bacteroidia bacterium]
MENLLLPAVKAALNAGLAILEVYNSGHFGQVTKEDNTPLTIADRKAHDTICRILAVTGLPVLSEEGKNVPYPVRRLWDTFWLVDPLDGTKEFIGQNGEFTINIALIHKNRPVAGVVYVPVTGELYFSSEKTGSWKLENASLLKSDFILNDLLALSVKLPLSEIKKGYVIVASRSHMTPETLAFIDRLQSKNAGVKLVTRGSSLKICMVAEGVADIYPRFATTMEWDTAAGHAIAAGAGCIITQSDGISGLSYNKENLANPWFIVKSVQFTDFME